jgi:hypothetical protein
MKTVSTIRSISAIFGIIAALLILLSGCKNPQQKQEGDIKPAEIKPREDVIQELSGYPIPSAYEITELVYKAGAPYNMDLSNDPQKAEEYITQRDKALNLGVYGTDLSYASSHGYKHWTMLFLEASKILIDELGISTNYNVDYAQRIEDNLDERDSVILIVSESFVETWEYLIDNKQDVLARLVVCGSWIEGVYITSSIANSSRDNTEFLEILAKQKKSLTQLVSLMEPVKDLDEVSEVFKGLFDLQDIYEDVEDSLTEEQLEKVTARITALRATVI